MASKKFEIVRPKSLQDSTYEDYEYLIRWIGRNGADYLLMFYDARLQRRTRAEIINSENADTIQSLISKEERNIDLFVDDLSKTDMEAVLQLFSNTFVTRIFKDGSIERYATEGNNYKYRLLDGRYEINISLRASDFETWS